MKIFFRLLQFLRPYRHFVPEYILYAILSILFGLVNYTLLIPLLDILFRKVQLTVLEVPSFTFTFTYFKAFFLYLFYHIIQTKGLIKALLCIVTIIFICIFVSNIFRYLSSRLIGRVKVKLLQVLRQKLYNRLMDQDLYFHYHHKKGHLLSTLIGDVQELENVVGNTIQNLLRDPLIIIVYFIVLFYISFKLTLFTLLFFPISGWLLSTLLRRLKKQGHFSQTLLGKLLTVAEESLSGIKVVKAFQAEGLSKEHFQKVNDRFARMSRKMYNRREMSSPISEFLGITIMLVLIVYGSSIVLEDQSTLDGATFLVYLAIYAQMITPLKNIASAVGFMQKALAVGERIFTILDAPILLKERISALSSKNITHKIRFEKAIVFDDVWFKYGEEWVLKGIHLIIPKGQHIALVGRSGSGKTTLVDLLLRFYDLNKGQIRIDDNPLDQIDKSAWLALTGFVSQEPILFNDSVLNNIVFGAEKIEMSEVIEASKTANAHEFIEHLKYQYYTNVGDRGNKLSGGQRQRLTIARAIYKNPALLLLDEATASLDTASEKYVQEALEKVMYGRTTITIAHRLSTIINADQIVVLDKGKIVEKGTHKELMAKEGVYCQLFKLQQTEHL